MSYAVVSIVGTRRTDCILISLPQSFPILPENPGLSELFCMKLQTETEHCLICKSVLYRSLPLLEWRLPRSNVSAFRDVSIVSCQIAYIVFRARHKVP